MPVFEMVGWDNRRVSAIATAKPLHRLFSNGSDPFNDHEIAEPVTGLYRQTPFGGHPLLLAAAGRRRSSSEAEPEDVYRVSAVADALPVDAFRLPARSPLRPSDDRQLSKPLAGEVYKPQRNSFPNSIVGYSNCNRK